GAAATVGHEDALGRLVHEQSGGLVAHGDGAQHGSRLLVEDADGVTRRVGHEGPVDTPAGVFAYDAGAAAHGHGVQHAARGGSEEADRVAGVVNHEGPAQGAVHGDGDGV